MWQNISNYISFSTSGEPQQNSLNKNKTAQSYGQARWLRWLSDTRTRSSSLTPFSRTHWTQVVLWPPRLCGGMYPCQANKQTNNGQLDEKTAEGFNRNFRQAFLWSGGWAFSGAWGADRESEAETWLWGLFSFGNTRSFLFANIFVSVLRFLPKRLFLPKTTLLHLPSWCGILQGWPQLRFRVGLACSGRWSPPSAFPGGRNFFLRSFSESCLLFL